MEFNCPDCGKRLRAPDHLRNPLVRCRTCGATFRPREEEGAIDRPEAAPPLERPPAAGLGELPQPAPVSFPRSRPVPPPASMAAKGFGIIAMILLIALAKAPRLLKLVMPDKPQQPAPVQIDPKQLDMLRDLQNRAARPLPPPVPKAPRRLVPNDDPFGDPTPDSALPPPAPPQQTLAPAPWTAEPQ